MKRVFLVGIDGGGTKTQVRIEDEDGQLIGQAKGGPGNIRSSVSQSWDSIHQAMNQVLSDINTTFDDMDNTFHVAMGMAGVEVGSARQDFLSVPHPNFKTRLLVSDAHIACLGAHGGKPGMIIIIGTGVNGYQIEGDQVHQVAGWGFPHSDEGGGAWLGMEAIRLTLQFIDGRIKGTPLLEGIVKHFSGDIPRFVTWVNQASPAGFGEIAPLIVQFAEQGDQHAVSLLKAAAHEIDKVADALLAKQVQVEPLPCVLLGGVSRFITPYLSEAIKARLTERCAGPTEGALWMLRQHLESTER